MRATIRHHSTATITSQRAGIGEARVGKLVREIVLARGRERPAMRDPIADIGRSGATTDIFADPPARVWVGQDALPARRGAGCDPAAVAREDKSEAADAAGFDCGFRRLRWGEGPAGSAAAGLAAAVSPLARGEHPLAHIGRPRAPGAAACAERGRLALAIWPASCPCRRVRWEGTGGTGCARRWSRVPPRVRGGDPVRRTGAGRALMLMCRNGVMSRSSGSKQARRAVFTPGGA